MLNVHFVLFVDRLGMSWVTRGENCMIPSVWTQRSFFFSYVRELVERTLDNSVPVVSRRQDEACVSHRLYKRCAGVRSRRMERGDGYV